jgi:hypothetical protein
MAKGSLRVNGIIVDTDGEIKASTGDSIVIREDDGSAVITVDTNGKTSIGGAMDVGVNDTGYDVKFFGAAAGAFMMWDEDADSLLVRGATADHATNSAGRIVLQTAQVGIADGDILGRLDFQAPDETQGGDGALVSAAIWAEADATFTATVNSTELVFATGASELAAEKMRITSDGKVGIGTSAPAVNLDFGTPGDATLKQLIGFRTNSNSRIGMGTAGSGMSLASYVPSDVTSSEGFVWGTISSSDGSTFAEKMRLDRTGKVGIGTSAPGWTTGTTYGNADIKLHILGTDDYNAEFTIETNDTTAGNNPSRLSFLRSRGTAASRGAVADNDTIGAIDFWGWNTYGTDHWSHGAQIASRVDGTPSSGSNDMPSDLVFSTSAENSGNPTERMVIASSGNVDIGGAAHPARRFSIKGAANDNSENTVEILNSDNTQIYKMQSDGIRTMPKQPAFCATISQYNNIATSSTIYLTGSERIDNNVDLAVNSAGTSFGSSGLVFTAPVTGSYQINFWAQFANNPSNAGYMRAVLNTSNHTYYTITGDATDDAYVTLSLSILADMDANDVASAAVYQDTGTVQIDIMGGQSGFSGYLVA